MRGCLTAFLLAGCYGPKAPSGAPCDPAAPVCPDGQSCQPVGVCSATAIPLPAIERLQCDLQYIQRWSLWLDIRIIIRTVVREFFGGSGD